MLVTMETSNAIALKMGNLRAACERYEQGNVTAAKTIRLLCLRYHAEGIAHHIPNTLDCILVKAWGDMRFSAEETSC